MNVLSETRSSVTISAAASAVREMRIAAYRTGREGFSSPVTADRSRRKVLLLLVIALVIVHTGLLTWNAWQHSATADELAHLSAGIHYWRTGQCDVYRVNPPLVRAIAAIPVLFARPEFVPSHSAEQRDRPEFVDGLRFVEDNGARSASLLFFARCACIPLSLIGACVCFRWASRLYGAGAGLVAMALWCFCPNVLGHGALITPDVGAAALGIGACYLFWRWLTQRNWLNTVFAGVALGFAALTKFTWVILFIVWPVLWIIWRRLSAKRDALIPWARDAARLAAIIVLGMFLINVGYGFEGCLRKVGNQEFISRAFAGPTINDGRGPSLGNRFRGTWIENAPLLLPANYVSGIDLQRFDFERGKWSYLAGEWRFGGWWHYYLYALAVKVPLGTWVLALLGVAVTLLCRGYATSWRDEMLLLAPLAAILLLVTAHPGVQYLRYVLPMLPFAFVWMSKVARAVDLKHSILAALGGLALAWSIASSLAVYPHSLSYFNELGGGPTNGHRHLLDSNIDWGQDLFYLKRWLDKHREARPIGVAYFGMYPLEVAGIEAKPPPRIYDVRSCDVSPIQEASGPEPGWYAVSVNFIYGNVIGGWAVVPDYTYFKRFRPVAMAGYSIYIYRITLDEANRVRRELGLPELKEEESRELRDDEGCGTRDESPRPLSHRGAS